MRITVRYAAQVRHAAGRADERVELDGPCSVSALVRLLAARHGSPLRELILDPPGQPHPALLLFVGDEQVEPGREPTLRDGDEVTLLAPMAGG